MATEKEIQTQILEYLEHHRKVAYFWRNNIGARGKIKFGRKGMSDILGVLQGGKFFAIEVKNKHGRTSDDQLRFISEINVAGGIAFVARSLEDVVIYLEKLC